MIRPLPVTVTNPNDVPIEILRIDVEVRGEGPCPASDVAIPPFVAGTPGSPRYVVPANSSVVVPMTAMLVNLATNQDHCKGAVFTLRFGGEARQWIA